MRINSAAMVILVAGAMLPYAADAAGPPPSGFRDIKWGASPSGLKKKADLSDGVTMYVPSRAPAPFLDVPVAEEAYFFSKGKFYSGSVWLDGQENLQKVKVALTKAYGQPNFVNERLNLWKWTWPSSPVNISLSYQAKFSRTTVTFSNSAI